MSHSQTYLLIRKAIASALIAALLALPLAGVQLQDLSGKNSLEYRPLWVLAAAGCVFVGSVLMEIWKSGKFVRSTRTSSLFPKLSPAHQTLALATLAIICGFFPMTPVANRYAIDLATTFLIYVMLGWGLNIVVGLAGLLDLGYVAFYAVGAYTFGILSLHFGVGFWLALPACGLAAAAMGLVLGFPVLRLKGDYLAIVTLGFGEIIRIVLINWASVTGGPNGISGVPRPSFFGLPFSPLSSNGSPTFASFFGLAYSPLQRIAWLYYIVFFLSAGTFAVTQRLRRLPVGRAWEALREDETACQALGLNPTIIKLSAFSLGAMLGGIAGCFFAARQGFISPESFTFGESAIILAIVVLGGMGNQLGVVIAAALLVGLPELGRDFAQFRMLFFGIAMVFIMVWRPQGLIAGRRATVTASHDQVSVISMEQAQ